MRIHSQKSRHAYHYFGFGENRVGVEGVNPIDLNVCKNVETKSYLQRSNNPPQQGPHPDFYLCLTRFGDFEIFRYLK